MTSIYIFGEGGKGEGVSMEDMREKKGMGGIQGRRGEGLMCVKEASYMLLFTHRF